MSSGRVVGRRNKEVGSNPPPSGRATELLDLVSASTGSLEAPTWPRMPIHPPAVWAMLRERSKSGPLLQKLAPNPPVFFIDLVHSSPMRVVFGPDLFDRVVVRQREAEVAIELDGFIVLERQSVAS
jgi:hypothetical protein